MRARAGWWGAIAGGILFPVVVRDPYLLQIGVMILLNVILASSLNLVMMTGQIPISHAAFMGLGAYASALVVTRAGISFWVALPLAGIIAAGIGALLGLATLKARGIYFAMATFAFGEVVRMVFIGWVSVFGGANGITNVPAPAPIALPWGGGMDFTSKRGFYWLTLAVTLAVVWCSGRLVRSRVGSLLRSLHDSESLAESVGVRSMRLKCAVFALACGASGLAGSLYAHHFRYISPQSFTFVESVQVIVFVVVGGGGTVAGPILGAAFLTVLPELLRSAVEYQRLIFAVVLIGTLLFCPRGIVGLLEPLRTWRAGRRQAASHA